MHKAPDALEAFLKKNGFIVSGEKGSKTSINYAIAWKSEQFIVEYSVSNGDPMIQVYPLEVSFYGIGITTLKNFIEKTDPKQTTPILTMDEDVRYLETHVPEIAAALTPERIEELKAYVLEVSRTTIENMRRKLGKDI